MNCAQFDDLSFQKWLVVLRGGDDELRERFVAALRAEIERNDDL